MLLMWVLGEIPYTLDVMQLDVYTHKKSVLRALFIVIIVRILMIYYCAMLVLLKFFLVMHMCIYFTIKAMYISNFY